MTIQGRAQELFDRMELKERKDGEKFYCLKDSLSAPKWMQDTIYKAHQPSDRLPDDSVYEAIYDISATLADADPDADLDQLRELIMEVEADPYTSQLTAWLNSHNANVCYLTEALEEGLGITDGFALLAEAQCLFKREIANAVLEALNELEEVEEVESK